MKKSQAKWVKEQLALHGYISRNQCLANYISRLSAIVQNLEEEGYTFNAHKEGNDYVYEVVSAPRKIIRYDLDPIRNVRYPVYG